MSASPIEGGCLCGAVRYRIDGACRGSLVCHCRTCRKAASSPTVAWLTFERDAFTWTRGQPASFASSEGVVRTFCGACGSPLSYVNERLADEVDVTTVSLDEPERHAPAREVWLEHRIAWAASDASLDRYVRGTSHGALVPRDANDA